MSAPPRVDKPIVVFISSAQREFAEFRHGLKVTIDTDPWHRLAIASAVVIEEESGYNIQSRIRRKLDESSIYVGILGKNYSKWVKAEYDYAKSRGIPLLIYLYKRPLQATGRSRYDKFIRQIKESGTSIRSPFRNLDELQTKIMADLAHTITEMVRESANLRRITNESIPVTE